VAQVSSSKIDHGIGGPGLASERLSSTCFHPYLSRGSDLALRIIAEALMDLLEGKFRVPGVYVSSRVGSALRASPRFRNQLSTGDNWAFHKLTPNFWSSERWKPKVNLHRDNHGHGHTIEQRWSEAILVYCFQLFRQAHTPVSYTHLDVYKRQDMNCSLLS